MRIEFNDKFEKNFLKFFKTLQDRAEHYEVMAEQLEKNPVLAIDYLRRAFLITGNITLRAKAKQIIKQNHLDERSIGSVEYRVC